MSEAREVANETNKDMGDEYAQVISDVFPLLRVSTGLISLDEATGGGLPLGCPISLRGKKGVSKSAFCYYMAGRTIEQYGGIAYLVQTEPGFSMEWATACGLPDKGIRIDATGYGSTLNVTLECILGILKTKTPRVLIIDSLSAMPEDPDKSIIDSKSRGGRAKPTNEFFRNLLGAISDNEPPLFLYVEHLHPNVANPYGGDIVLGGETKGYMDVLEIKFRYMEPVKHTFKGEIGDEELPAGIKVGWQIQKSKIGPTGGTGCFTLGIRKTDYLTPGEITDYSELVQRAVLMKIIKKAGAWFSYGEQKFQGEAGLKAAVEPETLRSLISAAREERRKAIAEGRVDEEKASKRSTRDERRQRKGKGDGAGDVAGGEQVHNEEEHQGDEGDT
jgi:recombination protein RecA